MLSTESLKIDVENIVEKITEFIRHNVESSGLKGAVVAASGGIDSSTTLALTARALGPENVRALTMPERDITPEGDITDVMRLARSLDVTCDTIDITPLITVMNQTLPLYDPSDRVSSGNLKARARMIIAYHYSNTLGRMVIGSSNKTEWLTGYFTKHGDGAVDLIPLADLYKNQIRQLARYLELPEIIIEKTPTAGLWPGQTDEGELGVTYDNLDLILYGTEIGLSEEEIAGELGIPLITVRGVLKRVETNEHKRRLPLILRLSTPTG